MSNLCSAERCEYPNGNCLEGNDVKEEGCPHYDQKIDDEILSTEIVEEKINILEIPSDVKDSTILTKWPSHLSRSLAVHINGTSISTEDLAYFDINITPTRYFNFLGFSNSGKTSLLLTYIYELRKNLSFKFLGSSTLLAWDSLLQRTEWQLGNPPSVPKPTAHESHLHTLVEYENSPPIDIILSDIAGEEVAEWASLEINTSENQKIQTWLKRSNIILLCLDLGELYENEQLNQWPYLSLYRKLLERLKHFLQLNEDIRVILLETKSDLIADNEISLAHSQARELTQKELGIYLINSLEVVSLVKLDAFPDQTVRILEILKYDPDSLKKQSIQSCIYPNEHTLHATISEWIL